MPDQTMKPCREAFEKTRSPNRFNGCNDQWWFEAGWQAAKADDAELREIIDARTRHVENLCDELAGKNEKLEAANRQIAKLREAAEDLCDTHGRIAFAVGSGMNPRNADWEKADDVLTRCRQALANCTEEACPRCESVKQRGGPDRCPDCALADRRA